jgi:hypothetical protein
MKSRLLKNLKYVVACPILIVAFLTSSVQKVQAETIFLFRSPEATATPPSPASISRSIQQKILKLDTNGDLLIQCGSARLTIAYNDPADQLKPSGQQYNPQRERTATINGISLTASLYF